MATSKRTIPPELLGTWKIVNGDYPLTRTFRADGTVVSTAFGFDPTPKPFRVEFDSIVFLVKQRDGSVSEQKECFELRGDTLTFIDPELDDMPRVFRRQAAV